MDHPEEIELKKLIPIVGISVALATAVFLAVRSASSKPGTVVLPGGVTYIGPSQTQTAPTPTLALQNGRIPVPNDASWIEHKGNKYPYTFKHPSLSLGVFPNDPYDGVTIFYEGTDSQNNLFFRVDDLAKMGKQSYINKSKSEYAQDWWKDYSWQGVESVTPIKNSQGLSGYRATYTDRSGDTPYDHVFFEVPGRRDLVIWISGKLFSPEVFDQLVDSVTWVQ